jgi:mono/diheme cytochrome c family protein
MRAIRRAAAPRGFGRLVLVLCMSFAAAVPASAADVIKGAQIYARHCASCHGPSGISVMPGAPHLARGERMMQPDLALLTALKAGKNAMPAYIGILADRDILDVIAYSRTLRQ